VALYSEATARVRGDGIPRPGPVRTAIWGTRLLTENLSLRCRLALGNAAGKSHAGLVERLSDNYAGMGLRASMSGDLEVAAIKYAMALQYARQGWKRNRCAGSLAHCLSRRAESHETAASRWKERFRGTGRDSPVIEGEAAAIAFHVNEPLRRAVIALFQAASHRKLAGEALEYGMPDAALWQYGQGYDDCRQAVEILIAMDYPNKEGMGIDRDFFGRVITIGMVYSLRNELFHKSV
jgi:hypothetical protein